MCCDRSRGTSRSSLRTVTPSQRAWCPSRARRSTLPTPSCPRAARSIAGHWYARHRRAAGSPCSGGSSSIASWKRARSAGASVAEGVDGEREAKQLAEWLGKKMPHAQALSVSPLVRSGATGFSSDTLIFDLAWREGGAPRQEGIVVRRAPIGHRVFPSYDIPRQHRILRILATTDVPVPRTPWLEE